MGPHRRERRMYASDEARDGDIERDAHRPLAVHLDDLRTSAYRFNSAAAAPRDRWSFEVATRGTGTERAELLPFHRLCEVELHHVDLGIGYTVADLPDAFVVAQVDALASGRFAGHPELPALLLSAGEGGLSWRTGATGRPR
ncbi:maleylpyruvate isomerase N-terminal domain-containing protein [Streptomyces sp. M19]